MITNINGSNVIFLNIFVIFCISSIIIVGIYALNGRMWSGLDRCGEEAGVSWIDGIAGWMGLKTCGKVERVAEDRSR